MNKLKQFLTTFRNSDADSAIYIYWMAFGLFITPYLLRQQIVTSFTNRTFLWGINYIALLALFLFVFRNILNRQSSIWYFFPALSLITLLPTQFIYPISWGGVFLFACCCILPQYILFSPFSSLKKEHCIRHFLVFFDCIILLLFITALIDKIADRFFIKLLASFLSCDAGVAGFAYLEDSEHIRFFSILGHPLTNAFLFNFCYSINILYNKYHKRLLPNCICAVFSLLSLICCGGKTGITVGIIITILTFYRKWQFYALAVISLPIIFISGILDNLIYRFTQIPLTTGRAAALQLLLTDERISFHFFNGYGSLMGSEYKTPEFSFIGIAGEFSFIEHSLHYGILFTLILLLTPFIYMTIHLWKARRFIDWFFWCLLYAEVNSYNGFSSCLDVSFIFYFLSFILLNITDYAVFPTPPQKTSQ